MNLEKFLVGTALVVGLAAVSTGAAEATPILDFNLTNVTVSCLGPNQLIQVNEYVGCNVNTICTDAHNLSCSGLKGLSTTTGGGFALTNYPFVPNCAPATNAKVTVTGGSNPNCFSNFNNLGSGNSQSGSGQVSVPVNPPCQAAFNTTSKFSYAFWLVTDCKCGKAVSAQFLGVDNFNGLANNQEVFEVSPAGTPEASFDLSVTTLPEPPAALTLGLLLGAAWFLRRTQLV